MIHLDTNYLVSLAVPTAPTTLRVIAWRTAGEPIGTSAMAWAEFMCGPLTPAAEAIAARLVGPAEPVTAVDAVKAAELFNLAGRRRGSLADCLIAAVALRVGASLATENKADFFPFVAVGLRVRP